MGINIQAGCSRRHPYGQEAQCVFAVLPRRHTTCWRAILRLLICAWGLAFFQSVVALAESPKGSADVTPGSWVYTAYYEENPASDVGVGSALGWLMARQVDRKPYDQELGGDAPGGLPGTESGEGGQNPRNAGSPYVPLDSWIYPALERLAALGYIHTEFLGMRPWTRRECARLVEEAGEVI